MSYERLRFNVRAIVYLLRTLQKDPGVVKGTKLKVLKYPHPKLRTDNEVVTVFDENLKQTASEMLLLMYAADGVGLAAPQVGINKRLMVFNEKGEQTSPEKEMILVNPVITAHGEEQDEREEGCLSFPQIYGKVMRYKWIEVDYQDIVGTKMKAKLEGWPARVFQHEYDHLDKVFSNRV
jgi:peptide deformylase